MSTFSLLTLNCFGVPTGTTRLRLLALSREIDALDAERPRLLVATDCLSEGLNLQGLFDAVVHYDLSWNPTRHQQREGRVDRFGQRAKVVRTVMMYGENSMIDGAVLEVITRKAEAIRKAAKRNNIPADVIIEVSRELSPAMFA